MKLLVAIVVLFVASNTFAQEKPVIIDEFGIVSCDDLLTRTNALGVRLTEDPAATGAVIISYTPESKARVERYRRLIYHSLRRWDFDTDRLRFYLGTEAHKLKVSVWVIPPRCSEAAYRR